MGHYVISDIHGQKDRFQSVIEQADLKPEDHLYVLGDVIDRHPYGIDILRWIMDRPNTHMLLGNHEHMMMNAICHDRLPWFRERGPENQSLWFRNGGKITCDIFKKLGKNEQRKIFDYLKSLPANIKITVNGHKYWLAHAAPAELFDKEYYPEYVDTTEFSVWCRDLDLNLVPKDVTLIFGHTPTIHLQGGHDLSIWKSKNGRAIDIDCGCQYGRDIEEQFHVHGRLACLRLEDEQVWYSKDNG